MASDQEGTESESDESESDENDKRPSQKLSPNINFKSSNDANEA